MHSNISKIKQLRLFPFLKLVGGGSMSQLYILEHLNAFLLNKLIKIHDCDMRNMAVSLDIVTVTFVYFVITRGHTRSSKQHTIVSGNFLLGLTQLFVTELVR